MNLQACQMVIVLTTGQTVTLKNLSYLRVKCTLSAILALQSPNSD